MKPCIEVSRLVLGYLLDMECKNAAVAFVNECSHFESMQQELFNLITTYGSSPSKGLVTVFGDTLLSILNEFSTFKSIINKDANVEMVLKHKFPLDTSFSKHMQKKNMETQNG